MKKLIAVIALAFGMGAAYADQPVALTDTQMDNVSAGTSISSSVYTNTTVSAFPGLVRVTSDASTSASTNPPSTSATASVLSILIGGSVSSESRVNAYSAIH